MGTSVPDLDAAVAWSCDTLGCVRDSDYSTQRPHVRARVTFLRQRWAFFRDLNGPLIHLYQPVRP